jgi:hypothetical protein
LKGSKPHHEDQRPHACRANLCERSASVSDKQGDLLSKMQGRTWSRIFNQQHTNASPPPRLCTSSRIRHVTLSSQSVLHASPANSQPALVAHHHEPVCLPIALLTISAADCVSPLLVVAVVAVAQVLGLTGDPGCVFSRPCSSSSWLTVDDGLRPSDKTRLIPLRAGARLPVLAAHVANLMAARTPAMIWLAKSVKYVDDSCTYVMW